ncbi:MAG: hypothetical protein VKO39_08825 [Cyanobacteriota bacterium]|nr:hypothetical protein [Cyanobacteriota bacterium]
MADRRQRIHELVLALLARQDDLELLSEDGGLGPTPAERPSHPGQAMKRSQRIIRHYQALVHSAVTLDALIDQELAASPLASSMGASSGPAEAG